MLRPSGGADGLCRRPAALPDQGRGRSRAAREPAGPAARGGRCPDLPRGAPEAHAEGQARGQRRAARGWEGQGEEIEASQEERRRAEGSPLANRASRGAGLSPLPLGGRGRGGGLLAEADLPDRPRLLPESEFYLEAFDALTTERPLGATGGLATSRARPPA